MNRDLWDNIKQSHIHVIAVPEGKDIENVELTTENSKFDENTDLIIQKAQQTPSRRNTKISWETMPN